MTLPKPSPGVGSSATPGTRRQSTAPAPRLRALDALRLLAALMVAGFHYGGRDGDVAVAWGTSTQVQFPTAHGWLAFGNLGVQIFFVISGFVICMSGWGRPMRAFFASRAARLLPSYWAAVILVTVVFALPPVAYEAVSASDALLNLTLLQQPLGADRVLGVCWTLWVELRFYALFALCVILPGANRQRIVLFCAVWTLAAAITEQADNELLRLVLVPQHAPFFIGGIGLYLVYRNRRDATAWGIVAVSWLIGQHYAVDRLRDGAEAAAYPPHPSLVAIAIVTAGFAAVAAIALGALSWANWRWLTTAGALTYPFYLVHEHLGWVAIGLLHRGLGLPSYVTFAVTVVLMLAVAWALHRGVERRLTPLLRARLTSDASPPPRPFP
ncbi:acyltransferase [Streptomyces sp. E11-3]|uniref:acyltransferase family protein n=1 Tax=Streptomyces sp. E11-3 TaxID=3110112 RepID=UPI0039808549